MNPTFCEILQIKTSFVVCDDDENDDDDDDDDDDDELFLLNGWPTKGVLPYIRPGTLLEILTISEMLQGGFEPLQNLNSGFVE